MKKLLLAAMLFSTVGATAQQYRRFLFALDLGYPISNLNPKGLVSMEPAYRLNDKILIGFRMETIGIGRIPNGSTTGDPYLNSMGLNGQYYFSFNSMRLFCGAGLGLYNPFIMNRTINHLSGLGVYPRIGIDFGHARVLIEYNFIQKMNHLIVTDFNPMIPTANWHYEIVNKSYLSLKIGFFIGGGRKK
jgi:hypothetical protein